ncbi:MAG TPA: tyrosine--tRNA ligase, partial [Myxococcota bacterium]|nr:tyrosine--tRNA ligase [Myxococcota bacterium]
MHVLDELAARGFVKQCTDLDALRSHLDAGPVTYYAGFDPTADSLHVGNLLPIMMMAHLQRAGHKPIAVVGGGTGMVGDPSGKTEARRLLDAEAVRYNMERQREQLGRFLDLSDGRGALIDNGEWLLELQLIPFLRDIGACFSVNRMLTAEGYRQRMERGLSFIEFNYQILQAYDFLVLFQRFGCTLQVGGDDQWGNLLAGVDLIRRKAEGHAHALTLPLLTTATGEKMGKTHAGAVWLDAGRFSPFDMYQYWYNLDDRDVGRFLRLYTFLPLDEIGRFDALRGAELREAKRALAWEVTALVHGVEAADAARKGAEAMVASAASADLPTYA